MKLKPLIVLQGFNTSFSLPSICHGTSLTGGRVFEAPMQSSKKMLANVAGNSDKPTHLKKSLLKTPFAGGS